MSTLQTAYRHIALKHRLFCTIKEGTQPFKDDSFVSVLHMRKDNLMIQINNEDINKNMLDETITKRYLTSELVTGQLKILAIAMLGIDYLKMKCELEDAEEARRLVYSAIDLEAKKLSNERMST